MGTTHAPLPGASDRALARDLEAGHTHIYELSLDAGEYVHLVLGQSSVDVVAAFCGPGIRHPLEIDTMAPLGEPEDVHGIARRSGVHQLVVKGYQGAGGRYSVELAAKRPATPRDAKLVAAERTLAEAERLRRAVPARASSPWAEKLYGDALRLFAELQAHGRAAEVHSRLGLIHWLERKDAKRGQDDFAAALAALAALEGRERPFLEAQARSYKGQVLHHLGDPGAALAELLAARQLWQRMGDLVNEAAALNELGRAYTELGENQAALDAYGAALELWRQRGDDRELATTLQNLGEVFLDIGRLAEAKDALDRSLGLYEAAADRQGRAIVLNSLGKVELAAGRLEAARELFEASADLRDPDSAGLGVSLSGLGLVQYRLGDVAAALATYRRAEAILERSGDSGQRAVVHHNLARIFLETGDADSALGSYRRAFELCHLAGLRLGEAEAQFGLARTERARGNLETARQHARAGLELLERLRSSTVSLEQRASFLASRQRFYAETIDLLMELDERAATGTDYVVEALAVGEQARARALLDLLADGGAELRRGAPRALLAEERALDRRLLAAEREHERLLSQAASRAAIEQANRTLRELASRLEAVGAEIRRSSPAYAALARPEPRTVAEIQDALLDEKSLLLVYILGDERSFLFALTNNELASFVLPERAELEAAAREAHRLLAASQLRQNRAATAAALSRLSELLLAPVANRLEGKRLLIMADGALAYLPFGALPNPRGVGPAPPLVAEHEVVSLPSASSVIVLAEQRRARTSPSGLVAVFADPVFSADDPRVGGRGGEARELTRGEETWPAGENVPRLPFSALEARAIVEAMPVGKSLVATGFAATREAVLAPGLEDYRFIHFATHGRLHSVHPELSGLLLSRVDPEGRPRDGVLSLNDLYNLEIGADLVVLSACETALGAEVRGEGLVGLAQGFLHAGAAAVVVSLWQVDDQASAELMSRFYRHLLRDGMPPAAALRQAQMAIRAQPRWSAPYYWAPFILEGDWRPARMSSER